MAADGTRAEGNVGNESNDGDLTTSEDAGGLKSAVSDGYQSASQRSQDSSTPSQDQRSACQRLSDSSTASQGNRSASQGSRTSEEPPDAMGPDPQAPDAAAPGAVVPDAAAPDAEEVTEPEETIETGRDYLSIIVEAESRKQDRAKKLKERNLNVTESTLLEEIEAYIEDERPSPPTSKQVGVRLRPAQWNRLLLVARWSGVRPTTMARILINRGARAIIDEELRYRRKFGPEAD